MAGLKGALIAVVLLAGSIGRAEQICFYELTDQNRARILIGDSRLYATPLHTDYSEVSALRFLLGLVESGECRLPRPGVCLLNIDMYGHAQVSNGEDPIWAVVIGRYGEEENGLVAITRFQEAGLCQGLKIKRAPQVSAY